MSLSFEMNDAAGAEAGGILLLSDVLAELGITSPTADESAVITEALKRAEGAVIRFLKYNPVESVRTEFYPMTNYAGERIGIWEANDTNAYLRQAASSIGDELQLVGLPVRERDSSGNNPIQVWVDFDGKAGTKSGAFGSSTLKTVGVDFHPNYDFVDSGGRKVCRDGILRAFGSWPSTAGSVKVQYVAGYTTNELLGVDSIFDASPIRETAMDETVRRVHKTFSRRKSRARGWGSVAPTSESLGEYSYSADSAIQSALIGTGSDLLQESIRRLEDFVNIGMMLS